jgi:hypothetical protein
LVGQVTVDILRREGDASRRRSEGDVQKITEKKLQKTLLVQRNNTRKNLQKSESSPLASDLSRELV